MENLPSIIDFINKSYTQYHVVNNIKEILDENDFIQIKEGDVFNIEYGKSYYIIRGGSSIIAFKVPNELNNFAYHIQVSHTDSPTFKIKQNPVIKSENCSLLNVEPYGSIIYSTWMDKPLSIAGRIVVNENNRLVSKLYSFEEDLLIIPNVAIHMERTVNNGKVFDESKDLLPLISIDEDFDYMDFLAATSKHDKEDIISTELYLYNRVPATLVGANKELLVSPKIDNLSSVYASLYALINSNPQEIAVYVALDNEEVGSKSFVGADSNFLQDTLKRITYALELTDEDYYQAIAKSHLVSVDNGHARHPHHPEYTDFKPCHINNGIIIKHNANQSYATTALSAALIKALADEAYVKVQEYHNKSNAKGGSTLSNISNTHVSILSVDIGIAQFSMHSSYETCGLNDIKDMISLLTVDYDKSIIVDGDSIIF